LRVAPNPQVRITGTGSCLPDRVVDNDALERLIHGYDARQSGPFGRWVDQVTHIHERRFGEPGTRTSDMAVQASRRALEAAGVKPSEVGMIVYASFTLSQTLPGDHCLHAEMLGAGGVPTFQLMAACAGSVYGLGIAYGMVAAGVYEHVLVVGSETISPIINYHDPLTAILFGDGAGAAVISRRSGPPGSGMLPPFLSFQFSPRSIHLANSNIPREVAAYPEMEVQPGVKLVEQALIEMEGGPQVLRSAVLQMAVCVARGLGYQEQDLKRGENGLAEALSRARVVPHQANGRIVDGLAERLKVRPERVVRTLYRYGNISAASNLVALDFAMRRGNMARRLAEDGSVLEVVEQPEERIRPGELVVLPTIGGGYLMGCAAFVA
jgi:3-oxoacyl-[acyl-carrier-protein] synthase-3